MGDALDALAARIPYRRDDFDPAVDPDDLLDWLAAAEDPNLAGRFAHALGVADPLGLAAMAPAELRAVLGRAVADDPDAMAKVPASVLFEFARRGGAVGEALYATAPDPLPPDAWLIHFTDDAEGIVRDGFHGTADPAGLDATFPGREARRNGGDGYNFAFEVGGFDALKHGVDDFYGNDAVLFQAPGLRVYHASDSDEEVVFHGPDAGDMILLRRGDDPAEPWRYVDQEDGETTLFEHHDINEVARFAIGHLAGPVVRFGA